MTEPIASHQKHLCVLALKAEYKRTRLPASKTKPFRFAHMHFICITGALEVITV